MKIDFFCLSTRNSKKSFYIIFFAFLINIPSTVYMKEILSQKYLNDFFVSALDNSVAEKI